MITAVPPLMPVTIPDADPTLAFELVVLQVPPVVISESVVVLPGHTVMVPVMEAGNGFTVAEAVT